MHRDLDNIAIVFLLNFNQQGFFDDSIKKSIVESWMLIS